MPHTPLTPASLAFIDGIPYAAQFDDVYHSAEGGLAQARHVFLGGNRLPLRWRARQLFTILETGFGLGLNFLATWDCWRSDPACADRLHYVALEKHPFTCADLEVLHARWPEFASLSEQLRAAWPTLMPGFHRLVFEGGRVILTLIFGDARDCLLQIDARVDAFYLDGFTPSKNPQMWEAPLLARLNRLAAPDATLATYTVAATVREPLTQAGFTCEKQPGFGRKREMLTARFTPRWQPPARRVPTAQRHAIVIGAGLAGSAACERLAARGWQITLVERHPHPAQEASGNLAGIVMPLISKDDNPTSRLARAAYLFTVASWSSLGGIGHAFSGERCGVLQLARDAAHARLQQNIAKTHHYPSDYAEWLGPGAASDLLGQAQPYGGWLFRKGGWVNPASLCDAMLGACKDRIERRFSHSIARLERTGEIWRVFDEANTVIAEAPILILANGASAQAFSQTARLPLQSIRGQVSHVPATLMPELSVVICGDGYATRPVNGICSVGASYDTDSNPLLRPASHQENLARLTQILPAAAHKIADAPLAGRVGFRTVSADRLPLVGAMPADHQTIKGGRLSEVSRFAGLYGLLAYASRGLIWAPFAAELLASELNGEPLPVERELAAALDPARFLLKAHRRGDILPPITSSLD